MSANSSDGFEPTFENGGFWEYYRTLERQFEDFLDYVPYLEEMRKRILSNFLTSF